jgi:hypothetical protein
MDTVTLFESNCELGGNVKDVQFKDPENPSGPYPTNPALRLGRGALRINQLSFFNQRCLANELGIEVEYAPFRGHYAARGMDSVCAAPQWQGNDQPIPPYDASPFQTSDNCSGERKWVGPVFVVNQTTEMAPVLNTTGDNDLPSPRFLNVPTPDIEGTVYNYLTGYSDSHPISGEKDCDITSGISCFMREFCSSPSVTETASQDFGTFLSDNYGPEVRKILSAFNYGFLYDFEASHACGWVDWTQREWDTNAVNGYPVGGMSEFIIRMAAAIRARQTGAIQTNTTVTSINHIAEGDYKFLVTVQDATGASHRYRSKTLLLALPPSPLARIQGDVVDQLRAQMEFKTPRKVTPVTVNLQFATDWWAPLMGDQGASYRLMGTKGCFGRTEFHQTPYLKKVKAIRAVYADHSCAELYEFIDELPEPKRTNEAVRRAMIELRENFPALTIPDPIGYPRASIDEYIGASFDRWSDGAWHWQAPFSSVLNNDVLEWAREPIANSAVCLAGDAWNPDYSGWITSGIRSGENCLNRFFPNQASAWKPADTACCEFRQTTNATVDGSPWYNYPFRYGFSGCGEENWSPGAAYLSHERWWPTYDAWQANAGSTQCVMPSSTEECATMQPQYVNPGGKKRTAPAKRIHPSKVRHGR